MKLTLSKTYTKNPSGTEIYSEIKLRNLHGQLSFVLSKNTEFIRPDGKNSEVYNMIVLSSNDALTAAFIIIARHAIEFKAAMEILYGKTNW